MTLRRMLLAALAAMLAVLPSVAAEAQTPPITVRITVTAAGKTTVITDTPMTVEVPMQTQVTYTATASDNVSTLGLYDISFWDERTNSVGPSAGNPATSVTRMMGPLLVNLTLVYSARVTPRVNSKGPVAKSAAVTIHWADTSAKPTQAPAPAAVVTQTSSLPPAGSAPATPPVATPRAAAVSPTPNTSLTALLQGGAQQPPATPRDFGGAQAPNGPTPAELEIAIALILVLLGGGGLATFAILAGAPAGVRSVISRIPGAPPLPPAVVPPLVVPPANVAPVPAPVAPGPAVPAPVVPVVAPAPVAAPPPARHVPTLRIQGIRDDVLKNQDGAPIFQQTWDDSCVVVSSQMVLQRLTGTTIPENALRAQSHQMDDGYEHNNSGFGTSTEGMVELLNAQDGIHAETRTMGPAQIESSLAEGKQVSVTQWNPGHRSSHQVVVSKVEKQPNGGYRITIDDPWTGAQAIRDGKWFDSTVWMKNVVVADRPKQPWFGR